MTVRANTDTDQRIEDSIKSSTNFRSGLDHIDVRSVDGVVVLTGTVADRSQKDLAEDTASRTPGVVRVDNRLNVAGSEPAQRSDDWIALKIKSTLLVKPNVSATKSKISVNNGIVTITGTAENQAQKELTTAYVKDIEGVRGVNNGMIVGNYDRPSNYNDSNAERSVGNKIDDSAITTKIKGQLLSHRSTSAIRTKVTTRSGVVSISGEAGSDAERDLVTKIAKDVPGVVSVDNEMSVNPNLERR